MANRKTVPTRKIVATRKVVATRKPHHPVPGAPPDPPPPAPTGPTITLTSVTTTPISAQVKWHLSEFATGYIEFGTTTAYGRETAHEDSYTYSDHEQRVPKTGDTDLIPELLYHYRIHGTNVAGNETITGDMTFTTAALPTGGGGGGVGYPPVITLDTIWTPTNAPVPALNVLTADPTTPGGTTHYRRIDNAGGTNGQGGNYYANHPAFSVDDTLYFNHYTHQLFDTSTWQPLRSLNASEPIFSYTDRTRLYDISQGAFGYWNTLTGNWVPLYQFSGSYTSASWLADGGISWNDRWIPVLTTFSGAARLVVLDRGGGVAGSDTTTIAYTRNWTNNNHPDHTKVSPSGAWIVADWEGSPSGSGSEHGQWILQNTTGLPDRRQTALKGNHCDVGKDALGNDVIVLLDADVPVFRMDQTGTSLDVARMLPAGHGVQLQQGHVSTQAFGLPGWALFSCSSEATWFPRDLGWGLIVAVKMDGSFQAMVYGWHRSTYADPNSQANYDKAPFATFSRSGKLVAAHAFGKYGPSYGTIFSL